MVVELTSCRGLISLCVLVQTQFAERDTYDRMQLRWDSFLTRCILRRCVVEKIGVLTCVIKIFVRRLCNPRVKYLLFKIAAG